MKTKEQEPVEAKPRKLVSVEQSQQRLGGIGRTFIYELMQSNEITRVKLGRRTFIEESSLDDFIERLAAGESQ